MASFRAIEDSTPPTSEPAAINPAASLFHALGDRSRLLILQHLQLGEHKVADLTEHLGLSQSTVSKHLACLRECGLVDFRPEGRASVYTLSHPGAVVELLASAEKVLALTGDAVTLCQLRD
ncbi:MULTISPECIES: ArsR/SmtB family transcription factor [Nesterenkonia]|uniref:Winged helix-turn-helix transcriptional regulator n=2 Tax=Nesterenkonia TaxID=57494 RepID=A0A5R9B907_9MICC|nr:MULTISPECIES: metalloregulator ArsR/SmtB family transcription factor [Nesterenkonia]MDR5713056.1 metalloregulator ArsR/SmtB family transcription factor [Nesterenkonia flava]TLP92766.1 winged helix-turn-helix transcriptional regulator [Nesterenkonia salmonea]